MGKIKIGYRKLSETKRGKTLNIPSIVLEQINSSKVELVYDVESKSLIIRFDENKVSFFYINLIISFS